MKINLTRTLFCNVRIPVSKSKKRATNFGHPTSKMISRLRTTLLFGSLWEPLPLGAFDDNKMINIYYVYAMELGNVGVR